MPGLLQNVDTEIFWGIPFPLILEFFFKVRWVLHGEPWFFQTILLSIWSEGFPNLSTHSKWLHVRSYTVLNSFLGLYWFVSHLQVRHKTTVSGRFIFHSNKEGSPFHLPFQDHGFKWTTVCRCKDVCGWNKLISFQV